MLSVFVLLLCFHQKTFLPLMVIEDQSKAHYYQWFRTYRKTLWQKSVSRHLKTCSVLKREAMSCLGF